MDLGIAGRRAAVAAGTAGLGLATARALAEEGVHVAVCGRDTDRLAEALAVLGPRAVGLVADMSAAGGPEEFAAGAVERLGGPIDIVVANAGVGGGARAAPEASARARLAGADRHFEEHARQGLGA